MNKFKKAVTVNRLKINVEHVETQNTSLNVPHYSPEH